MSIFISSNFASNSSDNRHSSFTGEPFLLPLCATGLSCISCGLWHNIFIYDDGTTMALGSNMEFQIGTTEKIYSVPTIININNESFQYAYCGEWYTIYLTDDGRVVICSCEAKNCPVPIQFHCPAIYVSGSSKAAAAIVADGSFYLFDKDPRKVPKIFQLNEPVYDLACGDGFIIAITTSGTAYGNGKLNQKEVTVEKNHKQFYENSHYNKVNNFDFYNNISNEKNDASNTIVNENQYSPILTPKSSQSYNQNFEVIESLRNIKIDHAFSRYRHAAVISEEGAVYIFGNNCNGQLGRGDTISLTNDFEPMFTFRNQDIVSLDIGCDHSVFVTDDGKLYSCGSNLYSQCCLGLDNSSNTPKHVKSIMDKVTFVKCGNSHTIILTKAPQPPHPCKQLYLNKSLDLINHPVQHMRGDNQVQKLFEEISRLNKIIADLRNDKKTIEERETTIIEKNKYLIHENETLRCDIMNYQANYDEVYEDNIQLRKAISKKKKDNRFNLIGSRSSEIFQKSVY